MQQLGQSIPHYFEHILKQTTKCKFGKFRKEDCKDQLVLGVKDASLLKRSLKDEVLTYEKASSLAIRFEAIERDRRILNSALKYPDAQLQEVHMISKINNPNGLRNTSKQLVKTFQCKSCRYTHDTQKCQIYGKNCNLYNNEKHIQAQCYQR